MQKDFVMIYITPTVIRGNTFSNITVSASSLSGMSVTGYTKTNTVWNCQLKDGNNYVLRGTELGDEVGTDVYLYFGFTYHFCVNTTSQTFCLIKTLTGKNSDTFDLPIKQLATSISLTAVSQISSSSVPDNEYYLFVERTGASYDIYALMTTFKSVVANMNSCDSKSDSERMTADINVLISILFLYALSLTGFCP